MSIKFIQNYFRDNENTMIKYIAFILVLMSFNNTCYARQVIDATVVSVYTHD